MTGPDVSERYFEGPRQLLGGALDSTIVERPNEAQARELAPLLHDVGAFVRRYVVCTDAQLTAIALWTAHTHAIDAAETTPYLSVTSAEKRSGKSRLYDLLELLVPRPWKVVTPTEAVTFRKIAAEAPTLLLDEVDTIFGARNEHEGLRALLNAGNRRGTVVPRCVGPSQALTNFNVFCAKALAGIGRLPDTVADRSIQIRMKRKARDETVERFRIRHAEPLASPLRDRLADWATDAVPSLSTAEPELPDALSDRAADGWEALFAIADAAGAGWPARARRAALDLADRHDEDDDSAGVRLLSDCRRVFGASTDRIATADLIAQLAEDEEAPWADWKGKGRISPRSLAGLLQRYGIRSRSIRLPDGETPKGYLRDQFEDAWERYTPETGSESATTPQPAREAGLSPDSIRHTTPSVAGLSDASNPHGSVDVADGKPREAA